MEISLFLAKAFCIYFIILSMAMLFNREYYEQAAQDMLEHKGVSLLTSIVTLILGIVLVLSHSIWVMGWPVIITLLGWLTLFKGIIRLILPGHMETWTKSIIKPSTYYGSMLFMVVLGLYLGYVGFGL